MLNESIDGAVHAIDLCRDEPVMQHIGSYSVMFRDDAVQAVKKTFGIEDQMMLNLLTSPFRGHDEILQIELLDLKSREDTKRIMKDLDDLVKQHGLDLKEDSYPIDDTRPNYPSSTGRGTVTHVAFVPVITSPATAEPVKPQDVEPAAVEPTAEPVQPTPEPAKPEPAKPEPAKPEPEPEPEPEPKPAEPVVSASAKVESQVLVLANGAVRQLLDEFKRERRTKGMSPSEEAVLKKPGDSVCVLLRTGREVQFDEVKKACKDALRDVRRTTRLRGGFSHMIKMGRKDVVVRYRNGSSRKKRVYMIGYVAVFPKA